MPGCTRRNSTKAKACCGPHRIPCALPGELGTELQVLAPTWQACHHATAEPEKHRMEKRTAPARDRQNSSAANAVSWPVP